MVNEDHHWSNVHSADILADKPERILPLDQHDVAALRAIDGLVIGEMAGRDAAAALVASLSDSDVQVILPVAVYMGAEYGDWQGFERNADFVRSQAHERLGKHVLPTLWLGSPDLWRALNGKYITDLISRFGRYSPCLACHFYLHAIRIPLALQVGAKLIIGGDREKHNARFKINQLPYAIDSYQRLMTEYGLELREPLRHVVDVAHVDALLGPRWPGGSPQPTCMFSGNYATDDSDARWTEKDVSRFLDDFCYAVLDASIEMIVAGDTPNYAAIARTQLDA